MGPTISPRIAVLVVSAAFLGSEAAAQSDADAYPPAVKSRNAPSVVSVDILRHPISGKVRRLVLRGMSRMNAGEYEDAISILESTLAKYPDSAAYVDNLLGVAYVKMDRYQEGVDVLEKAIALLPHDAMTHYNLGLALICSGDYERATQEVQRALELDPKNAKMQARLDALMDHAVVSGARSALTSPVPKR